MGTGMDVSGISHVLEHNVTINEIDFLGFRVTNASLNECVQYIDQTIENKGIIQIVPINANKLYQCRINQKLANIIREAALVVPEYAVVWGAKKIGRPLTEHIGGIMLMRKLLEESRKKDYRFYFLGAKEDIISGMVDSLPRSEEHTSELQSH